MLLLALLVLAVATGLLLYSMYRATPVVKPEVRAAMVGAPAVRKNSLPRTAPGTPYSATAIAPCADACAAVQAIGGKRFLDAERNVPNLPVQGCDAARCRCRYIHYADRRNPDDDRRHPSTLRSELYEASGKQNRRQARRGRRKSDWT